MVSREIHNILRIPALPEPEEPLVISVRELWEDERRRRTAHGLDPSPVMPQVASARQRGTGEGWVQEERYWKLLNARIRSERGLAEAPKSVSWEAWVMTTFESVQALWPEPYKTWRPKIDLTPGSPVPKTNPFHGESGDIKQEEQEINEEWLSSQNPDVLDREAFERDAPDAEWERWHINNLGESAE